MKRNQTFSEFAKNCIESANQGGRYSTAHLYKSALRSYSEFCHSDRVLFSDITRERIRFYYKYLLDAGLKLNTISTYMRMLRSLYNKATDKNLAPFVRRLFHDVYTGIDTNCKKAISARQLHKLLYQPMKDTCLVQTQNIAKLLFGFCGMSFADFAHLRPSNFQGGTLEYNRIKTNVKVCVQLQQSSEQVIDAITKRRDLANGRSPYMFGILSGYNCNNGYEEYKEYQSCLRAFNNNLKRLASQLGVTGHISSYTIRHSWATTAKLLGTPIELISESLGHTSIKTTQIYLKSFDAKTLGNVCSKTFEYIRNIGE